jgi:signal transduction histidine kinase/CheY-like chemotaxis protein
MSINYIVLIVDDSETDRETYRRYLTSAQNFDVQITECDLVESALEQCAQQRPDVILLDYLLPDADGLEFLQQFTVRFGALPVVIMLTGQGSESVAVEAMKYGVKDYLVKGKLTAPALINVITTTLATQALQRQLDQQRQQQALLAGINLKISQSFELSQILQAAVEGIRPLLGTDRSIVYQFHADRSGTIVAESVMPDWSVSIAQQLADSCFQNTTGDKLDQYLHGYKTVVEDIQSADLPACHIQMLQALQVKAVLAVPIVLPPVALERTARLWGLLIAHHCETTHAWQSAQINLLDELAMQMGIAIQQAELMANLKSTIEKQQTTEQELRNRAIEIGQINLLLFQTAGLLEQRNRELDEFSYIVSHDLKAPLRGISNLADWLSKDLEGQLPAENLQQLELIQLRALQMTELINGLLQYALVGRERIDPIGVNLSQLIAEVVDLLAPPSHLTVQFSTDLPTIKTQMLPLKQVLANLIGNAIKYHDATAEGPGDRPKGKVEIVVTEEDAVWQFAVIDNGPGIAPEHHQKIFGIFQTLAGRDDPNSPGSTGIGLAIIKKIVESRGGAITLTSALGQGSCFSFTWPKLP